MIRSLPLRGGVLAWLSGAILLLACAEDETAPEAPGLCAGRDCDCPDELLPACDITVGSCQRKIAERVGCVRGAEVELPEVEVITRDQFQERVMDMSEPDEPVDAGAPVPTEMPAMDSLAQTTDRAIETTLKQLRLIDPASSVQQSAADFTVGFVAGYYDGDTERITLIEEETALQPEREAMGIFAHELVHAAQDQEGLLQDIQQTHRQLWDALSAGRMVVEGEARLYGLLAEAAMLGKSAEQIGIGPYLDFELKRAQEEIALSSSPFWPARTLPAYAVGGEVLYDAWLSGGSRAVERTISTSTPTALGWMRGEPSASLDAEALQMPEPPPDFSEVFSARMGANVVFAFLVSGSSSGALPLAPSWELARSWVGDTLTVYTTDTRTAFAWRARFEDQEASQAFRDRVQDLPSIRAIGCSDTDSVLLWTDSDGETRDWSLNDPCAFPLAVALATINVDADANANPAAWKQLLEVPWHHRVVSGQRMQ